MLRYLQGIRIAPESAGRCARWMRRARHRLVTQLHAASLPRFPWCLEFLEAKCSLPAGWSWPFSLL